ncbi:Fe-S cluster assembly scaffold SufA [Escherichia coli]|nr:Fe-S cluster assembly scaffold SufA [Escherichia coli]
MDMHSGTFNPQDFAWQGLTLTPAAAIHIRELVAKQPGMVGVRLGVKQTGCAGFGYVLDSVSEPDKDDLLFEHDGAKLFVPLQAMPFIDGTEVDYAFAAELTEALRDEGLKQQVLARIGQRLPGGAR